ncbi:hypothetical protein AB2B41_11440 [Marimonas sp. MJW-29]|uniref:Porin n=1 Tax=Sulfitobacter sediminis TaxID=3234186 RepID=A0ABV3RNR0_9RHOB
MKTVMKSSLALMALAGPLAAQDSEASISGRVDLGFRYYFDDGLYADQTDAGAYPFLGFGLNGSLPVGDGQIVLQFEGLTDDENDRSVLNVQKAYFTQSFDTWDLVAGVNVENWGVSAGRTLVNVLNARDQANTVGGGELIGSPMVNANFFTGYGTLSAYVVDGTVWDHFGGRASRQRGPLFTDDALTAYENERGADIALRYANNFSLGEGAVDLGFYVFKGASREAVSLLGCATTSGPVTAEVCNQITNDIRADYEADGSLLRSEQEVADYLVSNYGVPVALEGEEVLAIAPYYQDIRQVGLTTVYARGDTQFRFEGFLRDTEQESFTAGIVGGDHTFFDVGGSSGNLVLALEYHFDNRSDRQPISIYDDDLFFGFNFSANDANDTRAEFGVFHDVNTQGRLYSLEFSRRFGDRVRASIRASHVESSDATDPLTAVDGDTFVDFTLSTFF